MIQWRGPLLVMLLVAVLSGLGAVIAIPRVIMGIAIDRVADSGGVNRMAYGALASPENQPVVRPSPDLAYSICSFDLSQGPVVVDVVPAPERYLSLSIFDARTDVIFVRNDVQAGGKPYRIALAAPGQMVPPGIEVVRSEFPEGIALIRLLLREPGELAQLQPVRKQSTCSKLDDKAAK